jgi:hypothetical protein
VFVLVSTVRVIMCPKIDHPTSCEIRTREGTVGQCCTMLKNRQTNVRDEERSVRSSMMTNNIVQHVDEKKIVKEGVSQFQNFHVNFPTFHVFFTTTLSQLS